MRSHTLQQAYKGPNTSCTIPITVYTSAYEARVRSWSTCTVNGLEEQLWSNYGTSGQCHCKKREEKIEKTEGEKGSTEGEGEKEELEKASWMSGRSFGIVVFVVLSVLTLIFAFAMGQYAL